MISISTDTEIEAKKDTLLYVSLPANVDQATTVYMYCTNSDVVIANTITIAKGQSSASITYSSPPETGFAEYTILATTKDYNTTFIVTERQSTSITLSSVPTVKGGNNLTLTVALDTTSNLAQTIHLEEENDAANPAILTVPSVATVAIGATSTTSTINTKTVTKNTTTSIVASYKGVKYYHNIVVTP
jgi:hypothetical protein